MESFYGFPRRPPPPPIINTIDDRIPVVPEVSVIENSFLAPPKNFRPSSYQPENCGSSFLSKKHVRFKSPDLNKGNIPQTLKSAPNLDGKTFKQIYMANVPDRHLDLSIFEFPNHETQGVFERQVLSENKLNRQTGNNLLNKCNNPEPSSSWASRCPSFEKAKQQTVDYGSHWNYLKQTSNAPMKIPPKFTEIAIQTEESSNEVAITNDEPTIKDLFKIIQQQNEQIMLLQQQVNSLKTSIRQPEIDSVPCDRPFMKELANSPSKKGSFSFDVKATSFQFSFRPPHKYQRRNECHEPKIQEIVESDNTVQNSLQLEESLLVKDRESYVSDMPSIEIKMDDYQCSDEESDDSQVNIGLTFYKDLMEQVNNVLKKVQQSECQQLPFNKTGQSMKAVKQATLQHLKNIGVNLTPIQESNEVSKESEFDINDPSQISCAVQQLLMKYLPEDKLVKAINKPKEKLHKPKEKMVKPPNGEFSFATLQYMKKYNLINSNSKTVPNETNVGTPKILNVTALKMQPKLL